MIQMHKFIGILLLITIKLAHSQSGPLSAAEEQERRENCGKYAPTESGLLLVSDVGDDLIVMAISKRHVMFSTANTPPFIDGEWVRKYKDYDAKEVTEHYTDELHERCHQENTGVDWMEVNKIEELFMHMKKHPSNKIIKAIYFGFCKGSNSNNFPSGIVIGEMSTNDLKPMCLLDLPITKPVDDIEFLSNRPTSSDKNLTLHASPDPFVPVAPSFFSHPWSVQCGSGQHNSPFVKKIDGVYRLLGFASGSADKDGIQIYPFMDKIREFFGIAVGPKVEITSTTGKISTAEVSSTTLTEQSTTSSITSISTTTPSTTEMSTTIVSSTEMSTTSEVTSEASTESTEMSTTIVSSTDESSSTFPTSTGDSTTGSSTQGSSSTLITLMSSEETTSNAPTSTEEPLKTSEEPLKPAPTPKVPETPAPNAPEAEPQEPEYPECPEDMFCFQGTIDEFIAELNE